MIPSRALTVTAVAAVLIALFLGLGSYPLLQPDEGRNAEIAREMLVSGRWLVPTYNGLPYLDKPAFFFRAVALSLGLLGESETAARLPSALFGLGTLGLVYLFCQRHYDRRTAVLAVLVVATSPLFFAFARFVIFDMTLAFFVTAAILAGYSAAFGPTRQRRFWYGMAAGCAGAATLVKGPVGFILPTLVLSVFHGWQGSRGWWREAFAWRNVLLFLVLVVPWFVGVSLQHPDFPYYGLVKESLQRFTTDEFRRTAPAYYYLPVILLGLFPWSAWLPQLALRTWQQRQTLQPADRLFVVWVAAVVVFFSLSQSKLPGYILTAIVALGILVARLLNVVLEPDADGARRTWLRGASLTLAACTLTLAVAGLLPVLLPDRVTEFAPRTARYLDVLTQPLAWLGILSLSVAVAALLAAIRRNGRLGLAAFIAFPLLLVPILISGMNPYVQHRSARALAERLPELPAGAVVACFRCYPNGWSFYSKRLVTIITANDGYEMQSNYIRFALQQTNDWPERMLRETRLAAWLSDARVPVLLLSKPADQPALARWLGDRAAALRPLTDEYVGALLLPQGM